MSNLRNINYDIIKDWILFRNEYICAIFTTENKKDYICFDEISEKILK